MNPQKSSSLELIPTDNGGGCAEICRYAARPDMIKNTAKHVKAVPKITQV
jgi:hypothetical protein